MNVKPLLLPAALLALSLPLRAQQAEEKKPVEPKVEAVETPQGFKVEIKAAVGAQAEAKVEVLEAKEDVQVPIDGPVIIRGGGRLILNGGNVIFGDGSGGESGGGLKPSGTQAPVETHDQLEFLNGDRLRGDLAGVDPAAGLTWKHEQAEQPITFRLPGLQSARLAPPYSSGPTGLESSLVHLTNDDRLAGRILSLDPDKLLLETWYAGTVSVKRAMIRRLVPSLKSQAVVYEGPDDLANWSTGGNVAGAWKLRNNALVCYQQSPIGRDIEGWPERARIDFDVAWDNYPGFNICFYADSLQIYNNNGYMLQVSGSSLYFRRQQRNKGASNMWNENLEKFNQSRGRKASFSLLVDRKKASFTLLIDGEQVRQWTDTAGFAGAEGKGIVLQPQAMGGMRFSNIRVSHWNGSIPDKDAEPDPAQDHLDFINRDTVSGELLGIADGKAKVKSSYGEVEVPLERISDVTMSREKLERARRNKEDIRANFAGNSVITFDLDAMTDGKLAGKSENFGGISIPLAALKQVEFNIYKKRSTDTSADEE